MSEGNWHPAKYGRIAHAWVRVIEYSTQRQRAACVVATDPDRFTIDSMRDSDQRCKKCEAALKAQAKTGGKP